MTDTKKPAPLCMLARIPNSAKGRATLAGLRQFLNTERYKLAVEFSGPRRDHRYGTLKQDANAFRLYLTTKTTPAERAATRSAWSQAYDAQRALDEARLTVESQAARLYRASQYAQGGRERITILERYLKAERKACGILQDERDVARDHALDQDHENEALMRELIKVRDELETIPRWLRALVKWVRQLHLMEPDPRG